MRQMAEHLAPALFRSGNTAPSAERLHGRVDTGLGCHRAAAPISGSEDINDASIDLRYNVVPEAEPLNRARAHVVDEHITLFHNAECDGTVGFLLEVELNHAFVVVARDVEYRIAFDSGWHRMGELIAAGRLHFDDISAHCAEQFGSPRTDR